MRKLMVLGAFSAAMAGCEPPEQAAAFIEGVLPLVGPECSADAGNGDFVATSLLDIGADAATANNLVLPLRVRTNLPSTFTSQQVQQDATRAPNYPFYGYVDNNIVTFTSSEVFFSTDSDNADGPALQDDGTPISDDAPREIGVSGVAFNEQTTLLTPSVVFVTAITKEDATRLQNQPFVNEALVAQNANGTEANRVRITVNVRIAGSTTGGAEVLTPTFPYPVELCSGCLTQVPDCGTEDDDNDPATAEVPVPPIVNDQVCVQGQDAPNFVCP